MRRLIAPATAIVALLVLSAPALACGGLIGPNGAVNLLRTSTFAAYHGGVEHYVTAFEFAGGEGEFGSLVPLPGVPTSVEKGGDWTLQRLALETTPVLFEAAAASRAGDAEELLTVRIDALDITILRGGGDEVGRWATEHGFRLPPDAPEVLDFYARRSPIFMAAVFDADAARERGQQIGDGTPVHLTIPTDEPWVPLRILGLGKQAGEQVQADVYLLTDREPALLPDPDAGNAMDIAWSAPAGDQFLADLRSDRGMAWIPEAGWLTKLAIDAPAGELTFDLAIDASGADAPSPVAAGFKAPGSGRAVGKVPGMAAGVIVAAVTAPLIAALARLDRSPRRRLGRR